MSDELGTRHVPLGEGLAVVRVRIAARDSVLLRGMLAGFDHLASVHDDGTGVLAIVTPTEHEAEVRAWIAEAASELDLELVA